VGAGFPSADGQGGVEQQHTGCRPTLEVPVLGW
jgi:hypothetical protein